MSGVTLLGLPTEIYSFGIQYLYVISGVIIMGFIMSEFFLPVLYDLNITSTYEVIFRSLCINCNYTLSVFVYI